MEKTICRLPLVLRHIIFNQNLYAQPTCFNFLNPFRVFVSLLVSDRELDDEYLIKIFEYCERKLGSKDIFALLNYVLPLFDLRTKFPVVFLEKKKDETLDYKYSKTLESYIDYLIRRSSEFNISLSDILMKFKPPYVSVHCAIFELPRQIFNFYDKCVMDYTYNERKLEFLECYISKRNSRSLIPYCYIERLRPCKHNALIFNIINSNCKEDIRVEYIKQAKLLF